MAVRERGGLSWRGGYCLHIKSLPPTPRKSSNLPCKVLQFNFSIVQKDNPLIIEEEVALSPGQRPRAHGEPRSGLLTPSLLWPSRRFISTRGVPGCLPISAPLQVIFPSRRPDRLPWWRLIGVWAPRTREVGGWYKLPKAFGPPTLYRLKITS